MIYNVKLVQILDLIAPFVGMDYLEKMLLIVPVWKVITMISELKKIVKNALKDVYNGKKINNLFLYYYYLFAF